MTLAGACAAGSALGGCAGVATYRVTAPVADGHVEVPIAEFERLAIERNVIRVEAPGLPEPVLLYKLDGGAFRALGSTCTHQQCSVRPGATFVTCGCHGSTFELTGAVVRGPAARDLPVYGTANDAAVIRIAVTPTIPPANPT